MKLLFENWRRYLNEIDTGMVPTQSVESEELIKKLLSDEYVQNSIKDYNKSVTGSFLNREQLSFVKIYLRRICMALEYAYAETLDPNLSDDEINKLSKENLYNTNFYNTLDRISLEFERAIEQSIPSKDPTIFDETESLKEVNNLIQQYTSN